MMYNTILGFIKSREFPFTAPLLVDSHRLTFNTANKVETSEVAIYDFCHLAESHTDHKTLM